VLTGAALANRSLLYLGVSGDGDSASIGLGQFAHLMRRGVNMTYIVENNGVYGLTKGQFSATADKGSKSKKGVINSDSPIDLAALALQIGATYVARSFSGDKEQMVPLIKGAIEHGGAAFIDIISPCVTFNNHDSSTKSYKNVKDHDVPLHELGFIQFAELEQVEIPAGEAQTVTFPDGSKVTFRALREDHDPTDRMGAMKAIHESHDRGEFLTGLLYINPGRPDFNTLLDSVDSPLCHLDLESVKPGREVLAKIMDELT
ncbi:MAG TPA: thiamine pyrophosphate-dependent enzyme, partial [Holophagaceae bacterium]|nr:thiamine pyrophosphate-dependent enzyme [Holophagaceae bacterium]